MSPLIQEKMVHLCRMLAERKYKEIEQLSRGVRLSADEISGAINAYGRTVVAPPPEAVSYLDVVYVKGTDPKRWSIRMPLWTKEEGRSDLTVEVTVTEKNDDLTFEIDDLHVL